LSNYLVTLKELQSKYYDPNDEASVLEYAQQILNHSLRPHLSQQQIDYALSNVGKGSFGNILEEGYFKVKNNNKSRADIPESGIEIKSGQVNLLRGDSFSLKEKLKISMIDYIDGFNGSCLKESKLWPKLEKILLLLFKRDISHYRIDEECIYSDILIWSEDDINQMSEDWLLIKNMVTSGKANEISEGHTWYLGASTAGVSTLRKTPIGPKAKTRAFSLKPQYLNFKLGYKSSIKNAKKAILKPNKGQTLEDFIMSNMKSYFDKPLDQIASSIGRPKLSESTAKNMKSKIARALLEEISDVHTKDVTAYFEQFRKAGVLERTAVLEESGSLIQSLSFPAIKWMEINAEDEWEDSELYSFLTSKFFFTVFKKTSTTMPLLIGCFFWTMPQKDVGKMRLLWMDTRDKVRRGEYDDFIGMAEHDIGHVRPHGVKGATYPTPQCDEIKRMSFWLNHEYIRRLIVRELGL
jgi:hypothetical protein